MFVSKGKDEAVVFAFSLNSRHWSALVPPLFLKGLLPDAEYIITEPIPNNIQQSTGTNKIVESLEPAYQLGHSSCIMTGQILMKAGLPIKFYTLDDSLMFTLHMIGHSPSKAAVASTHIV